MLDFSDCTRTGILILHLHGLVHEVPKPEQFTWLAWRVEYCHCLGFEPDVPALVVIVCVALELTPALQPLVNHRLEGVLHEVEVEGVELDLPGDAPERAGQPPGVLGRDPPEGGVGGHPAVARTHLHAVEPLVHVRVLNVLVQLPQGMVSATVGYICETFYLPHYIFPST